MPFNWNTSSRLHIEHIGRPRVERSSAWIESDWTTQSNSTARTPCLDHYFAPIHVCCTYYVYFCCTVCPKLVRTRWFKTYSYQMLSVITKKIETHLTIEKWTWGINMILYIYIYRYLNMLGDSCTIKQWLILNWLIGLVFLHSLFKILGMTKPYYTYAPPGRDSESCAEFSFLSTNHLEGEKNPGNCTIRIH